MRLISPKIANLAFRALLDGERIIVPKSDVNRLKLQGNRARMWLDSVGVAMDFRDGVAIVYKRIAA